MDNKSKAELKVALAEIESILTRMERLEPVNEMKKLSDKQRRFSLMYSGLVLKMYSEGYEVTHGETFDDDNKGHIAGSTHYVRLAGDANLFLNGKYLTRTEDHLPFGEWWERFGGTWGGRFSDGNHYSIKHNGVK